MSRAFLSGFFTCLLLSATATAQTVANARVVRDAVILEQSRGDSAVITTISPGLVIEVIAESGDWYETRLLSGLGNAGQRTGWINRTAVELLPGRVTPAPAAAPQAAVPQVNVAAAGTPQLEAERSKPVLSPETVELLVSADLAITSVGGNSTSSFALESILGFVTTSALEVVISTEIAKVEGLDVFGSLGGGVIVNFADDGPIIPFMGGLVGRRDCPARC